VEKGKLERGKAGAWWVVVTPYVCLVLALVFYFLACDYDTSNAGLVLLGIALLLYVVAAFFTIAVWLGNFSLGSKLSLAFLLAFPFIVAIVLLRSLR
jgi:hypothetical protein